MVSGIHVELSDNTKRFSKQVASSMSEAITDVTLDMKRVSSAAAPHDSGYLEGKADSNIKVGGSHVQGSVSYTAINKGFNYAEWTHNADYNLGTKSKRKSGGKSKYGSGVVPVGKGYLANTLINNKEGYIEHVRNAYIDALG